MSDTAAIFMPVTALIRVDLPTLGLPTTVIKPERKFFTSSIANAPSGDDYGVSAVVFSSVFNLSLYTSTYAKFISDTKS